MSREEGKTNGKRRFCASISRVSEPPPPIFSCATAPLPLSSLPSTSITAVEPPDHYHEPPPQPFCFSSLLLFSLLLCLAAIIFEHLYRNCSIATFVDCHTTDHHPLFFFSPSSSPLSTNLPRNPFLSLSLPLSLAFFVSPPATIQRRCGRLLLPFLKTSHSGSLARPYFSLRQSLQSRAHLAARLTENLATRDDSTC
ncbi:uncharacterized protein DS421_15g499620 [Arachis hypogaea]|nr:uncharacterized protein DS421_15g499620 [Arachis hypogaea]